MRAAAAAAVAATVPAYREWDNNGRAARTLCPGRPRDSRCYVARRSPLSRLLFARRRDAPPARSKCALTFYRDNVKMGIDARPPAYGAENFARDNGPEWEGRGRYVN